MRRIRIAASGAAWSSAVAMGLALAIVSTARAGNWVQVACVNPDGSAAPSQGWSGDGQNNPEFGSTSNAQCAPGSPMLASLSDGGPAPAAADEYLQYTPPSGSTLNGGTLTVALRGDGRGSGAAAAAAVYEPAFVNSNSDVFVVCSPIVQPCQGASDDYTGTLSLPAGRGGDLFLGASCLGAAGTQCTSGASDGAWALVSVSSADLLLTSTAAPQGTAFGGSALQRGVGGTAHLVFTASDPGGPGVYELNVSIDGRIVWAGTPNTNGGACVPVGRSGAALMFDYQQPCPPTEVVDLPVPTSGLPDGAHELSAQVVDAAGNGSTVVDQTIDTSNPQTTPSPRSGLRARFVISWSWMGRRTVLRSITVARLPRSARVSVKCSGPGCPTLMPASASGRRVKRLLDALRRRRFTAGDKLLITVTARRRHAERIELTVRDNRMPRARLLKR